MDLKDLQAFLNPYSIARSKKDGVYREYYVSIGRLPVKSLGIRGSLFLVYETEDGEQHTEHRASSIPALIKKMKKDIDGLT